MTQVAEYRARHRADQPGTAAPVYGARESIVILGMLVLATVTWRTKVYYSGGFDPVVLGKAALSVVALAAAFSLRQRCAEPRPMGTRTVWFLLAFLGISTFGAWTAGSGFDAAVVSIRVLIIALAVVLLVRTVEAATLVRNLLAVMLTFGVVVGGSGLLGFLGGARLKGGLLPLHPNEIAMLCGLPALGLMWLVLQKRAKPHHILLMLVALGMIWATGSRTGLFAIGVGFVLMLLQARRPAPTVVLGAVIAVPVGLYVVLGTSVLSSYFERGGSENVLTFSARTIAWTAAFTFPETEWIRWFGAGLTQKIIPVDARWWDEQTLDSSWVSALVQAGYLGAALLAIWVLAAFIGSMRSPHGARMLFTALLSYLLLRSILESGLLDATPAFMTLLMISLLSERTSRPGLPQDADPDAVGGVRSAFRRLGLRGHRATRPGLARRQPGRV